MTGCCKMTRLGGDTLYLLPPCSSSQMMSFVLESEDSLLVIDGGTRAEADFLERFLLERGGRVDAWFVTHPHYEHIGAVTEVLARGRISVGKLYYRFPSEAFLRRESQETPWEALERAAKRVSCAVPVKGERIRIGTFAVTPLTDGTRECNGDVNNASVVYRVDTRGESILFPGDLTAAAEAELIKEFPEAIRCPVVQMAHHGQQGLSREFYRRVGPEVALWCTPDWLWDNDVGTGFDRGPFRTLETRSWMRELGTEDIRCARETVVLR